MVKGMTTMLKIESKFEYNVKLKNTYKSQFDNDRNNYAALHQYILSLLFENQFVDNNGAVNMEIVDELEKYLEYAAQSDKSEPYEALFYYELNRALSNEHKIDVWLKKYPDYMDYCKLCVQSYDFLAHIGLFDAAMICCQDIYNATLINNVDYINRYSDLLKRKGDLQGAFNFLIAKLIECNLYIAPHIIDRTAKLAIFLNREDEMLELFRKHIADHEYAKWISRGYINVCLAKGLTEEAQTEYERLLRVTKYVYKDSPVTKQTESMFKYFCSVRKLMEMEYDKAVVAEEIGVQLQFEERDKKKQTLKSVDYNSPWENDFNRNGNKALLKRVNKMNKPFRTYFKAFAGGEKELIYAKSILGNYISLIYNRFENLFGFGDFVVSDYNAFYEAFPFYSLNGFTEEEIDEVTNLLVRIRAICTQLNPFVKSRSFPIGSMLADTLSVNTEIKIESKVFKYRVYANEPAQITLFGAVLFMSTFMNNAEKESFAFELAGSDVKLTNASLKQVFKTIPAATITIKAENGFGFADAGHEKEIFSLFIRRELFRFLLEFECQIIKEYNLLDPDFPNINSKYFNQLLEMKYLPNSKIYINVKKLHNLAIRGVNLGEMVDGEKFTIGNIVELMSECCDKNNKSDIFQAGIECMFIISVNRKYYNQIKWDLGNNGESFLKNTDNYCRKMLFINNELMTVDDEYILYDCSEEHLFTHINDVQAREFNFLFNTKAFEWKQITINMYKIDADKCSVTINDKKISGEYFMANQNDNVEIAGIDGYKFKGWNEVFYFDSPIAKFVIHEAKF